MTYGVVGVTRVVEPTELVELTLPSEPKFERGGIAGIAGIEYEEAPLEAIYELPLEDVELDVIDGGALPTFDPRIIVGCVCRGPLET